MNNNSKKGARQKDQKLPGPLLRPYNALCRERPCDQQPEEIRAYFKKVPKKEEKPTYKDPETGKVTPYRAEFLPEYHLLRMMHMPPRKIRDHYLTAARDVIRNDDAYRKNNVSLSAMDDDTGNRAVRWGSQRKSGRKTAAQTGSREPTDQILLRDDGMDLEVNIYNAEQEAERSAEARAWASIRETVYNFGQYDEYFRYPEGASLFEQISEKPILDALRAISTRDEEMIELLVQDEKRIEIVRRLGVAPSTVTNAIGKFKKKIEPYALDQHYIMTDEELARRKEAKKRCRRPVLNAGDDNTASAGVDPEAAIGPNLDL